MNNQNNYPDVVPEKEHLNLYYNDVMEHIDTVVGDEYNIGKPFNRTSNKASISLTPKCKKMNIIEDDLVMCRKSNTNISNSGSELNIPQYQSMLDLNYARITLDSKQNGEKVIRLHRDNANNLQETNGEDITSIDSTSNHSFGGDEDVQHNLASLSPASSLTDEIDIDDDISADSWDAYLISDYKINVTCNITQNYNQTLGIIANHLPAYISKEERKNRRNLHKIILPDGRVRDIDMCVIEPYKRVLSHGGYLKAGGHNAIVIFCACHLPDRSRTDYSYVMDNLFLYVVKTLEQLVTDEYVLIYLHGASSRRNVPPFPWLKRCYQLLDWRLRKSLKNVYLVHPTFWIKSFLWMARPFVSNKFWQKLVYVKSLDELNKYVATVEGTAIPDKVKQFDAKKH